MLTAMLLAHILTAPATASVTWTAHVYLATQNAVVVDRHAKAEALGRWLDGIDGERIRALAVWTPFSDDADNASPFEE